jgi:hypothetical protein
MQGELNVNGDMREGSDNGLERLHLALSLQPAPPGSTEETLAQQLILPLRDEHEEHEHGPIVVSYELATMGQANSHSSQNIAKKADGHEKSC